MRVHVRESRCVNVCALFVFMCLHASECVFMCVCVPDKECLLRHEVEKCVGGGLRWVNNKQTTTPFSHILNLFNSLTQSNGVTEWVCGCVCVCTLHVNLWCTCLIVSVCVFVCVHILVFQSKCVFIV